MAKMKAVPAEQTTALAVMPKFVAKEAKTYEVEANFEEMEVYLKGQRAKYKDVAFSPDDMNQVIKVNTEMVGLRTSLTAILEAEKKKRYNTPKANFQKRMDALIGIAGEVEAQTRLVIDAKDQERIDELNEIFESYKEHFQTVYNLEDRYLEQVEFRKGYYNKTAKEKESKDDLEAQFKDLKAQQTARNGSIKLIQRALKDTPQINEQAQIDKLDAGTDVASILDWIEGEQQRLADLKKVVPAEEEPEEEEPEEDPEGDEPPTLMRQVVGVAEKIDFTTEFPGKTKTALVSITYPYDGGDALTALFKHLGEFGITAKIVGSGKQ